jgi:antitoxin component YwqK of YwqJK toxin-antitoxin module
MRVFLLFFVAMSAAHLVTWTNVSYGANGCHSRGKGTIWTGQKGDRVRFHCSYYSNGQLESETQWVEGKQHGVRRVYRRDGSINYKTDYWYGHIVKTRAYNTSGRMIRCSKFDEKYRFAGSCMPYRGPRK